MDYKFVQVLIEMDAKLRDHGHGLFIVLSDLMSNERPDIPSVCFRKSRGVVKRVGEACEAGKAVYEAVRVFNSREGEVVEKCSEVVTGNGKFFGGGGKCSEAVRGTGKLVGGGGKCFEAVTGSGKLVEKVVGGGGSWLVESLDSVTVSEKLVENVEKFVEVMDVVTNGGFLRGEESKVGEDWVEFEWLKGKGYYGIESFVVNRLEVALRLSWMNCSSGKKRGVKLKEKVGLAGVAANVFWRKKGCVDWWGKLDVGTKKKIFRTFIGKAAKSMVLEFLLIVECIGFFVYILLMNERAIWCNELGKFVFNDMDARVV